MARTLSHRPLSASGYSLSSAHPGATATCAVSRSSSVFVVGIPRVRAWTTSYPAPKAAHGIWPTCVLRITDATAHVVTETSRHCPGYGPGRGDAPDNCMRFFPRRTTEHPRPARKSLSPVRSAFRCRAVRAQAVAERPIGPADGWLVVGERRRLSGGQSGRSSRGCFDSQSRHEGAISRGLPV